MKTIERVMHVMTHVNIGATAGLVAWLLWSGWQVASGEWVVPRVEAAASPCCLKRAESATSRTPTAPPHRHDAGHPADAL